MLDGTIKPSDKEISSDLWDLERRPSDGHTIEQVVNDVKFLGLVALARRKKRFDSGALALNKTKLSFVLDKKSGNPTGMRAYPIRKSNNLVEEYMLLANFLVAQRLLQAYVRVIASLHTQELTSYYRVRYGKDGPSLLRNHPRPAPKPLEELRKICVAHNIALDTGSAKTMQTSLEKLRNRVSSGGRFQQIDYDAVIGLLTRPMKQAQYLSAGGTWWYFKPFHCLSNITHSNSNSQNAHSNVTKTRTQVPRLQERGVISHLRYRITLTLHLPFVDMLMYSFIVFWTMR